MNSEITPPRLFEWVRLLIIQPAGYPFTAGFNELVQGLYAAFSALGARVDVVVNEALRGEGINIVLGAHLIAPGHWLPANSIIFNLEQVQAGELAQSAHYMELLKRHPVIDYSERNAALIRERVGHAHVHRLALGYMPVLSRVASAPQQDVDVLFYGVVNERRRKILDALIHAGLAVKALFGVFGAERDQWIARSKVVLNVHHYEDKIHEIIRSSYLLANRKAVVSECDADTEIDDDLRAAIVAVPYNQLVENCVVLVRDDARRHALERQGFDIFARRDQAALLAALLPRLSRPVPQRINLGSGKSFDPEQLNIDIDPKWQPDVLGDLAAPAGLRQIYFSRRFGLVRLEPGQFDQITTMDVLEHVPDLVSFMTRCLELLRVDGEMHIGVPYDLAWGAWQDPTHVRAFNERSWLYYTEWHWYLGWTQARFSLANMTMVLSPVGDALRQRGMANEELFRTPRAVDSMQVVLLKCLLSEEEKEKALAWQTGAGNAPRPMA